MGLLFWRDVAIFDFDVKSCGCNSDQKRVGMSPPAQKAEDVLSVLKFKFGPDRFREAHARLTAHPRKAGQVIGHCLLHPALDRASI